MSEPQSAARPPEAGILLPHEAVAAALAWPQARWEQGLAETPEEGVFAAGVLLAEMLTGTASEQRTAARSHDALERRFQDLPEDWGRHLDPPLQAQITRALNPEPELRFAEVSEFQAALSAWAGTAAARTLETLLARMRRQGDFPALADSMGRILQVAGSDDHSLEDLAREILRDVALTQQLLRVVNSAQYAQVSGMVTTVSRAVGLVGFNGVRNLALSLKLLERMPDQAHAGQLKTQFLRALMAGSLASELCASQHLREDAFLAALFQNLGRMLLGYYFPAEAVQMERAVAEGRFSGGEVTAALHYLGLSLEDFGCGVARSWGLPADLLYCMRRPFGRPPARRPQAGREYLRWLAVAANDLTAALTGPDTIEPAQRLKAVTDRYARVLGLAAEDFQEGVIQAQARLKGMADALGFPASQTRSLTQAVPQPAPQAAAQVVPPSLPTPAAPVSVAAPAPAQAAAPAPVVSAPKAAAVAAPGVRPPAAEPAPAVTHSRPAPLGPAAGPSSTQARTSRLGRQHEALRALERSLQAWLDEPDAARQVPLAEGLRKLVTGLHGALETDRVVFCLRDPQAAAVSARLAVGAGAAPLQAVFRVELGPGQGGALGQACRRGELAVVPDVASDPALRRQLPAWLCDPAPPAAYWLLPLLHRDQVFALLYADAAEPGTLLMDPGSRELLRRLGGQLVQLFRLRQARPDKAA